MKKAKKIILITFYLLIVFIIGFEVFHYVKNGGNVILYVSNQSQQSDTVDIKVLVDGKEVVNDIFIAGNLHNYKEYPLKLSPIILHEIEVYSEKVHTKMVMQTRFYFVNWILLDLWNEEPDLQSNFSSGDINYTEIKEKIQLIGLQLTEGCVQ